MPHREPSAGFEKSGIWILSRYRCVAGNLEASRSVNRGRYDLMMARQVEEPILVLNDSDRRRNLWLFRDDFYWEDDAYSELEVRALILDYLGRRERRVQRAVALMQKAPAPETQGRQSIPTRLRILVWNRDGGRCVECGSEYDLQFDHLIPVGLGGATSAENLQLLCQECNRAKGASLA